MSRKRFWVYAALGAVIAELAMLGVVQVIDSAIMPIWSCMAAASAYLAAFAVGIAVIAWNMLLKNKIPALQKTAGAATGFVLYSVIRWASGFLG